MGDATDEVGRPERFAGRARQEWTKVMTRLESCFSRAGTSSSKFSATRFDRASHDLDLRTHKVRRVALATQFTNCWPGAENSTQECGRADGAQQWLLLVRGLLREDRSNDRSSSA